MVIGRQSFEVRQVRAERAFKFALASAAWSIFVVVSASFATDYSFDVIGGSIETHSGSWFFVAAGLITLAASVGACVLIRRGALPQARAALAVAMWVGLVGLGAFILCSFARNALLDQDSQASPEA